MVKIKTINMPESCKKCFFLAENYATCIDGNNPWQTKKIKIPSTCRLTLEAIIDEGKIQENCPMEGAEEEIFHAIYLHEK